MREALAVYSVAARYCDQAFLALGRSPESGVGSWLEKARMKASPSRSSFRELKTGEELTLAASQATKVRQMWVVTAKRL